MRRHLQVTLRDHIRNHMNDVLNIPWRKKWHIATQVTLDTRSMEYKTEDHINLVVAPIIMQLRELSKLQRS